jgi:hypothetical protein
MKNTVKKIVLSTALASCLTVGVNALTLKQSVVEVLNTNPI